MKLLKARIFPTSPFVTPLIGDMLFGQICFQYGLQFGSDALETLLHGYTCGSPWLVVSDAFPGGFIPKPFLPPKAISSLAENLDRKAFKKKTWLSVHALKDRSNKWGDNLATEAETLCSVSKDRSLESISQVRVRWRNSIHRLMGSTDSDGFAPRAQREIWFAPGAALDVYFALDEAKLQQDVLLSVLKNVGELGFGKSAGVGYGRFAVSELSEFTWPTHADPNCAVTLSRMVNGSELWDQERSGYSVHTHFGKHGGGTTANPFKKPLLMMAAGAALFPSDRSILRRSYLGRGIGGVENPISLQQPKTVHQGYAIFVPVKVDL